MQQRLLTKKKDIIFYISALSEKNRDALDKYLQLLKLTHNYSFLFKAVERELISLLNNLKSMLWYVKLNLEELKENIEDAVKCHFDEKTLPHIVRLRMVKDEVMAI